MNRLDWLSSVYLLPCFEKFLVLRRCGFNKSQMQHKLKIVSYCSMLNYFSVLTNCVNMYCFVRNLIPCWRNKKEIIYVSTSYVCDKNYFIILRNDLLFFIIKIGKGTTQIPNRIYEFFGSSKLWSVRIFSLLRLSINIARLTVFIFS